MCEDQNERYIKPVVVEILFLFILRFEFFLFAFLGLRCLFRLPDLINLWIQIFLYYKTRNRHRCNLNQCCGKHSNQRGTRNMVLLNSANLISKATQIVHTSPSSFSVIWLSIFANEHIITTRLDIKYSANIFHGRKLALHILVWDFL